MRKLLSVWRWFGTTKAIAMELIMNNTLLKFKMVIKAINNIVFYTSHFTSLKLIVPFGHLNDSIVETQSHIID